MARAPAQFVFHVLICNNSVFYEGYFLKLPQHDGNTCGALTHGVTRLAERRDEKLLFSDSYPGYGPVGSRRGVSDLPPALPHCSPLQEHCLHNTSAHTISRWVFLANS